MLIFAKRFCIYFLLSSKSLSWKGLPNVWRISLVLWQAAPNVNDVLWKGKICLSNLLKRIWIFRFHSRKPILFNNKCKLSSAFILPPSLTAMDEKEKKLFSQTRPESEFKSQSHICRRLLDGHFCTTEGWDLLCSCARALCLFRSNYYSQSSIQSNYIVCCLLSVDDVVATFLENEMENREAISKFHHQSE